MELRPNHQFNPDDTEAVNSLPELDFDPEEVAQSDDPLALLKKLGGIRIPELRSPEEVRQEARKRSDVIFTSYETLHKILERHEATLQKRWLKKTRKQRLKILLDAWPDMPLIHRPDFDAFRKESQADRERGTKYKGAFMWPYINQEDLVLNTKTLPLLLNARGRNPPSHFAAADIDAMRLGKITEGIVPIFLNEYIMIMNGITENTRDYGALMAWEDHPDAFDWMTNRKQLLPGEGLLILEVQGRILEFLVECCEQLLHDIPEPSLITDSYPVLPEPQLKRESEISGFKSLAVMAAEAPYRVPAQLDLGLVESLLSARASAAEDHVWALREDPDYLVRQLLEIKDHRLEMLKDSNGKDHPVFSDGRQDIFWARIIGTLVWEAYSDLEIFSELSRQAKQLESLQRKYAAEISPSKDLPAEYLESLVRFRFYLDNTAKAPLTKIRCKAPAAPPLRSIFVREPPPTVHATMIHYRSKSGIELNKDEEQLTWLLSTLWEDDKTLFFASMPLVVDELDRLLQSEPDVQKLLSSHLTEVVGDLSIISQCLNQLNVYQPWAQRWEFYVGERREGLEKEYKKWSDPWGRVRSAVQEKHLNRVVKLGEPSGGRFAYPFEKRRTQKNVEALRSAEANLDELWTAIDQVVSTKAGDLPGSAIQRLLSQQHVLQRTREWVEPETTPAAATSEADTATDLDVYSSYLPISRIYSGSTAMKLDIAQPKTKAKTRGTPRAAPAPVAEAEALLEPNPADRQPTFSVDARAFKVFRTLFFNPAVTSTPGEVPWHDFLHAMASVGFGAMKLYGSVWQFQPTNLDVERSIQFHEPHPKGKVPFTVARRIGRRLNRAYGWFGGMFVLSEK